MTILVKVKTRQKVSQLKCSENQEYTASVKALPSRNQANIEVIDLISEYFGVSQNKIKIKLGRYSHIKTIFINE